MEKTDMEIFAHVVYHLNSEPEHKIKSNALIDMVRKSVTADLKVDEITEGSINKNISKVVAQGIADKVLLYEQENDFVCIGEIKMDMLKKIEAYARADSYLKHLVANKKV